MVLDELLAVFSAGTGSAAPGRARAAPAGNVASAERDASAPGSAPGGRGPGRDEHEPATQSTRAMSDTEIAEQGEHAPPHAPADGLVPEATRRSARRSKKEARREAKREKKRLAEHAKAQKKARRQTKKARGRGKDRPQPELDGEVPFESDVRIITPDHPAAVANTPAPVHPTAVPTVPPQPGSPDSGRPTVRIDPELPDGVAEELPDPVYVAGSLDVPVAGSDDAARSTVFIDEDPGTADVVPIDVATAAARMEPRLRERRIAVKRAVGRRRLKWAAIVAAVLVVIVAVLAVLGSSLFEISSVRVEGRVYSGGDEFDSVIGKLEGANVLRVDTGAAERALEAIPWVESARVSTDFPNGATIEVRERTPSISFQGPDGRYRVIDADGRVLDVIAGQPVDYLELFVTDGSNLEAGQMTPPGYRAAATLAQALTPSMRARVESISVNASATDLRLMLDAAQGAGGIEVRFGAAEDLVDKLVRLQTALTDPDPERPPTTMIDVSGSDLIIR